MWKVGASQMCWSIQRKNQSLLSWRFATPCCFKAGTGGYCWYWYWWVTATSRSQHSSSRCPLGLLCRHPSSGGCHVELGTEMKGNVLTSQSVTSTMPGSQNRLRSSGITGLLLHRDHRTSICIYTWFEREWREWKGPSNKESWSSAVHTSWIKLLSKLFSN